MVMVLINDAKKLRPRTWIRARGYDGKIRIGFVVKQNRARYASGKKTGKNDDITVRFPNSEFFEGWIKFDDVVEILGGHCD